MYVYVVNINYEYKMKEFLFNCSIMLPNYEIFQQNFTVKFKQECIINTKMCKIQLMQKISSNPTIFHWKKKRDISKILISVSTDYLTG